MRRSPGRHTLAVLRLTIGLGQEAMAKLCDCSKSAIQRVELGLMPLSAKLGAKVAIQTGIRIGWLITNDVEAPLVDNFGETYTKSTYERVRAERSITNEPDAPDLKVQYVIPRENHAVAETLSRTMKILTRARRTGDVALWAWKIAEAVADVDAKWTGERPLEDEFETSVGWSLDEQKRPKMNAGRVIEKFEGKSYAANEEARKDIKPTKQKK
jgi:transcriptional regulator with XRE-family HTH domain